jgi:hypothetical protein
MRCSHNLNERVNTTTQLIPNFLTQRIVAENRIAIIELVRPPVAGFLLIRREVSIISLMSFSVIFLLSLGTSVIWAPNAFMVNRFSSVNASEKTA